MLRKRSAIVRHRGGAIAVIAALALVVVLAFLALAIDLGVLSFTKNQLQNAADASALAAAGELVPDARPPFPWKSPLPVAINVPGPVALQLSQELKTSLSVLGQEIPIVAPQGPVLNRSAVIAAAKDVASDNCTLFHPSLQVAEADVELWKWNEPVPAPPLLPLLAVNEAVDRLLMHATWRCRTWSP